MCVRICVCGKKLEMSELKRCFRVENRTVVLEN